MKFKTAIRFTTVILFTLLSGTPLLAQNQGSVFVPEVGQEGKDVVWVPTPQELVDTMLSIAGVSPADYVVDLGSGDGRTVITAAKLGARATGVEYNPEMVALSKRNASQEGYAAKTEFLQADLFEFDLSKATVITMFLLPDINLKLRPKILDLKPGTRIVSNTFTMGEWEADLEVTTEENWNSWNTALLWYVPAKVNGDWKLDQGVLSLDQEFQMFYGKFNKGGTAANVSDGRLRGEEITFKIGNNLYTGTVKGNTMSGTFVNSKDGKTSDWSAAKK
jgi:SAM-dependent methyltransferase